jgi:hypothetical protein
MFAMQSLGRKKLLGAVALLGSVVVGAVLFVVLAGGKDGDPRIEVTVSGVPDYIHLGDTFDVEIGYENLGDGASGDLQLWVELPGGFALEEAGSPYSDEGRTLRWQLDPLAPGESGSVALTLRGSPPEDTSGANYNYEGYEGYAAFEDGFEMTTRVTAADGEELAQAKVVADTGGVNEIDLSWLIYGSGIATWNLIRQGAGIVGTGLVSFGKRQFFTDDSVPSAPFCPESYRYRLRVMTQGRVIQTQYIVADATYCISPPA